MSTLNLSTNADYREFLTIQLAARRPVEAWLEDNCPSDLRPPKQSHLIAADLRDLGLEPGACRDGVFAPARDAHAMGAVWAIAGSHLGNRMMLGELAEDPRRPVRFLSDPAMIAFWRELRPRLDEQAPDDQIARMADAAAAVFETFLSISVASSERLVA